MFCVYLFSANREGERAIKTNNFFHPSIHLSINSCCTSTGFRFCHHHYPFVNEIHSPNRKFQQILCSFHLLFLSTTFQNDLCRIRCRHKSMQLSFPLLDFCGPIFKNKIAVYINKSIFVTDTQNKSSLSTRMILPSSGHPKTSHI